MDFSLDGKVAIVTGYSHGWFSDIAKALAKAKADVVIAAMQSVSTQGNRTTGAAPGITTLKTDITDRQQISRSVHEVTSKFGKIDILVNAADIEYARPVLDISDAEWRKVLDINLNSAFWWTQAVVPHMKERKQGRIINIASGLAVRGVPNFVAYSVSKGGLCSLTRTLAVELGKDNIRVTAVAPGWYRDSSAAEKDTEGLLTKWAYLRRLAEGSDIASLVTFLASEAADYVSGHMFFADGGAQIHL